MSDHIHCHAQTFQMNSDTSETMPQRCDAKRPCTTCLEANGAPECEYEIVDTQPRPFGHPQFLFWSGPGPSSSRDVSTYGYCATGAVVPEFPTKVPVATITQSGPELEAFPPARALIDLPRRNTEPQPHTSNEVRTHNPPQITLPSFSVLSTLIFPRIPHEPHVTLSSLGAERFQLSDAALGELDMKLYASRAHYCRYELTIFCQPAKGHMQTDQTRNPLHF